MHTFRTTLGSVTCFASYLKHNLENSRESKSIYPYFCYYILSFFLPFQDCLFYCFLTVWKNSHSVRKVSHSFRVNVLVTNSLSFPSYGNVLTSPQHWRTFLLNIGFRLIVTFFQHLKYIVPLHSGLHDFWWEPIYHWIFFPYKQGFIFLWLLLIIFSSSLVCRSLIMIYIGMDFFGIFLFGIH